MNDSLLNLHDEHGAAPSGEGETFYRACGLMRAAVAYIDAVDWRYASEEQAARVALAARLDALSAFNLLGSVLDAYRNIGTHQQVNLALFDVSNGDKPSGVRSELTLQSFDISVTAQNENITPVAQAVVGTQNKSSSSVDDGIGQSDSTGEETPQTHPNEGNRNHD